MAYRHSAGEINPERDDPARDDPEKDDPERDDQLSMSCTNQFSRSSDEQEYISPHSLAIPEKMQRKKYYICSKSPKAHPERDDQFSMSFDDQFSRRSD